MIKIFVLLELFNIIVNAEGRTSLKDWLERRPHVDKPLCSAKLEQLHVHYIQGVASRNNRFISFMKEGMIRIIDDMFKSSANEVHSGVSYFTRKQREGSSADTCWTPTAPTWTDNPKASYDSLVVRSGERVGNSQLDALYGAAIKLDWPILNEGDKRLIILFTEGNPELESAGSPPFNPDSSCEDVDFPPLNLVEDGFEQKQIAVIYVVGNFLQKLRYEDMFVFQQHKGVIIQSVNPRLMKFRLEREAKRLLCGMHSVATKKLQVLYAVDNSYDTDPNFDLRTIHDALLFLMVLLSDTWDSFEVALTSFVDRPILGHGQSGVDYCYKEHVQFTKKFTEVEREIKNLPDKSGLDFRESQFDALKAGIESESIGWHPLDESWLKVVIIGTDSIPHEKVEGSDLNLATEGCLSPQYPSRSELREIIEGQRVFPIVVVSNYLKPYWIEVMKDLSEHGMVVGVDGSDVNEVALDLIEKLVILSNFKELVDGMF